MSVVGINKLKTCRCCLKEYEVDSELHEFSSELATDSDPINPKNFIKISACYADVLSIMVVEEDEDTTKICSGCLGDLKFCYLFRRKCMESIKILEEEEQDVQEIGKLTIIPSKLIVKNLF